MIGGWGSASVSCGGGEVSGLDRKGGPRRRRAAGSGFRSAAGKEASGFGVGAGGCWGVDTESSSGGFWSTAAKDALGLVAAGRGAVGSVAFVLPRDILEQVCR